jgi:hypothetical protein
MAGGGTEEKKNLKWYHSIVTHVLDHFYDMCFCKVSCCLHMYFLWWHHLPPDKSENDEDSDSDWLIYILYWHMTVDIKVFNIWVSHTLEMTIIFYYPTLELFFIYPTFYSLKILFTQPRP